MYKEVARFEVPDSAESPMTRWNPMIVAAVVCALAATNLADEKNDRHDRAVAEIERLGGVVKMYKDSRGSPYSTVALGERWTGGDAGLIHLRDLLHLTLLDIRNVPITDQGMAHLACLTALEGLYLRDTKVTDKGMVHLKPLVKLKRLSLRRSQISVAGMTHLTDLKELIYVEIGGTQLTSLRELRRLLPQVADW